VALHIVPVSAIYARGESIVNANVNASANTIAAQPSPSAAVNKFLAMKPGLFKSICILV